MCPRRLGDEKRRLDECVDILGEASDKEQASKQAYRRRYASPGVLRVHDPEQTLLFSPSGVSRTGHHVQKEEAYTVVTP